MGYYKLYKFKDTVVDVSLWKEDTNYVSYPYVAEITLSNVTSQMIPNVVFETTDSVSGNFSPVVESYDGGVRIWCKEVPVETLTIPTITCQ